jgi:hypothetical protein
MFLLMAELARRGHETELLTNRFCPDSTFTELLPPDFIPQVLAGNRATWCLRAAARLLRLQADVVVAHNHPAQFAVSLFKALRPDTPCAWICNEIIPLLTPKPGLPWRLYYALDKRLTRKLNLCMVNSAFTAESFRFWYGREPRIVHSGVRLYEDVKEDPALDSSQGAPWMADVPERFVLCVSRLEEHKNIRFLENLAEHLGNVPILAAGGGPLRPIWRIWPRGIHLCATWAQSRKNRKPFCCAGPQSSPFCPRPNLWALRSWRPSELVAPWWPLTPAARVKSFCTAETGCSAIRSNRILIPWSGACAPEKRALTRPPLPVTSGLFSAWKACWTIFAGPFWACAARHEGNPDPQSA